MRNIKVWISDEVLRNIQTETRELVSYKRTCETLLFILLRQTTWRNKDSILSMTIIISLKGIGSWFYGCQNDYFEIKA